MDLIRLSLTLTVCWFSAPCYGRWELDLTEIAPLLSRSCTSCHKGDVTNLPDLSNLNTDLSDPENLQFWIGVHDAIVVGSMPPPDESRPDRQLVDRAVEALHFQIAEADLHRQRTAGRVSARRLTRTEFCYTLQDLLHINADVSVHIPAETISETFDTVGDNQRLSALHLEGYLRAADEALDHAIQLGPDPRAKDSFDFLNNPFMNAFHEAPLQNGGSVTRREPDGVAMFLDLDYLTRASNFGFSVSHAGVYRITTRASAIQSEQPVTLKLIRRNADGRAALVGAFDLTPDRNGILSVDCYLQPGDDFYVTFQMECTMRQGYAALIKAGGAKNYKGRGILIHSQEVEGPLVSSWPPAGTRWLLQGMALKQPADGSGADWQIEGWNNSRSQLLEILVQLAPHVFRRPVRPEELQSFAELAQAAVDDGRDLPEVMRLPLRSMLSSPQFLMFRESPGMLDGYALANRLSYFLWKSMPDRELFQSAASGRLTRRDAVHNQVNRLLADPKSARFVSDFVGQWLRLDQLNATTPDTKLYPEYDELLDYALVRETELFFAELIRENLSVSEIIDSEFTFLNSRLAEHYGVDGIAGQDFRKVVLPSDSPRGGVLTQAAVLKTTANGTVTSPVTRGCFVLTNLLGQPPGAPPASVEAIDPDTRGMASIRDILSAHRSQLSCSRCHRLIDPPGFALESFDPIGGFRTHYRANLNGANPNPAAPGLKYSTGPAVDASGETADGQTFDDITEFKQLLLDQREQVARNLVRQLVVFATGGAIGFADRAEIEAIMDRTRENGFRVRDLIHEVVASRMFRCQ